MDEITPLIKMKTIRPFYIRIENIASAVNGWRSDRTDGKEEDGPNPFTRWGRICGRFFERLSRFLTLIPSPSPNSGGKEQS